MLGQAGCLTVPEGCIILPFTLCRNEGVPRITANRNSIFNCPALVCHTHFIKVENFITNSIQLLLKTCIGLDFLIFKTALCVSTALLRPTARLCDLILHMVMVLGNIIIKLLHLSLIDAVTSSLCTGWTHVGRCTSV